MALGDYYGPLPLWGWAAAAGGAFLLWKHHQSTSSGGTGVLGSIIGDGSSQATTDDGSQAGPASPYGTNDQWGTTAINDLVAAGYDPVQADYAIRNYLAGTPTDPGASTLIGTALRNLGAPPELLSENEGNFPTMPSPTQAPPGTTQIPKPVGQNISTPKDAHQKHVAHLAHVKHLEHVAATKKKPVKKTEK